MFHFNEFITILAAEEVEAEVDLAAEEAVAVEDEEVAVDAEEEAEAAEDVVDAVAEVAVEDAEEE